MKVSHNKLQVNKYNGILVWNPDNISNTTKWEETEVAFIIDGCFWVNTGKTLELGNDVVLKFTANQTLNLSDGVSNLKNYKGKGVHYTSYKDDTRRGDTNGDGKATASTNHDWDGIYDDKNYKYFAWPNIHYDSH